MSVAVYVMPLSLWLSGRFRTTWDRSGEEVNFPGPERSAEEVRVALDSFGDQLDRLLAFRPEWDDSGPARSATIFSLEGFALPFELARRWAYRFRLPRLCSLEPPQIWLPTEFDPVFRFPAPWNPESEVRVASCEGTSAELARLLRSIEAEERPELEETGKVAERLLESARLALERRAPVIIEL